MNCANHTDRAAVAYCRNCGKPLCTACVRSSEGTIYCDEHAPAAQAAPPYGASAYPPPPPGAAPYGGPNPYAVPSGPSPGLAFILGLIPGVGAVYNGQYAKGLIHAIIFGLLIS